MTKKTQDDVAEEARRASEVNPQTRAVAPFELAPQQAPVVVPLPYQPDEIGRLLDLADHETGYAQKQAITDLRKVLGRPAAPQGPAALVDRGPFQGRTPEEIAAGLPAGGRQ